MRYQLEVRFARLVERLGLDDRAVAAELGINLPHVRRLRTDTWTEISRADLQAILCWCRRHDCDVFSVEPSPIWRTLPEHEVVLLRGSDKDKNPLPADAQTEAQLLEVLTAEQCKVTSLPIDSANMGQVVEFMKTKNCIFIGSPKHNLATEAALTALWPSSSEGEKCPFQFLWNSSPRKSLFGRAIRGSETPGISVRIDGKKGFRYELVPVDWKSQPEYVRWTGRGKDAGALVVCHKPLKTDADVTTIILAGFSGFATIDMAKDIVTDGFGIPTEGVQPDTPIVRILSATFKKAAGKGESRERIERGRKWLSPPWEQLASLSKGRSRPRE